MQSQGSVKILADENISPILVQFIKRLGGGHIEAICRKPHHGKPDDQWIPIYTSQGYVILSCDRQQIKDAIIARSISYCGARMIYLPAKYANSRKWDQAVWILRQWGKIIDCASKINDGELVVLDWYGKPSNRHSQTKKSP